VQMFKSLGGPFAAFGLGIVPENFLKALKENPGRIRNHLQLMQDIQNDRQGKKRTTIEWSNPTVSALKLFSDPINYITSYSRIGPLSEAFHLKEDEDNTKYKGLGQIGLDLAQGFIPGLEAIGKTKEVNQGHSMGGQPMSLVDKLADVIEEQFFDILYKKNPKPKVLRAEKKKIEREVGF
jgi:hypothetical protein